MDFAKSPSATVTILAGTRFGKYQLVRRLAKGGMAELYLARSMGIEGFEKLVVLKLILAEYANNESFTRMFVQEARLAATLHHPNVAQVFDIGKIGSSLFFTMEYVHGADLRQIVDAATQVRRRVPIEHAISIVQGAAAGLHYAHEKVGSDGQALQIVHRDVSPSNVLVSYDGCVKMVDFGIAKAAAGGGYETRPGVLMGKVCYMSPEQCRREPLDQRSDIFSLGILLYELTTGHDLYEGESEYEILEQLVREDAPPPTGFAPDYPPELREIVVRALRSKAQDRFASAQDLQLALEDFAREHKLVVSPVALARFMSQLFGRDLDAWHQAEQAGKTLIDFLSSPETDVGQDNARMGLPEGDATIASGPPIEAQDVAAESDAEPLPVEKSYRALGGAALACAVILAAVGLYWGFRPTPPAPVPAEPPPAAAATPPVPGPAASPPRPAPTRPALPTRTSATSTAPAPAPAPSERPAAHEHPLRAHPAAEPKHIKVRAKVVPKPAPKPAVPHPPAKTWDPDAPFPP